MLTMMHDNDIASKLKATICILFAFGQIIASIIRIQLNSKYLLFGTALIYNRGISSFKWSHDPLWE